MLFRSPTPNPTPSRTPPAIQITEAGRKFTPELEKEAINLFRKKQIAEEEMKKAFENARIDFSKKADDLAKLKEKEALSASYDLAQFEGDLLAKNLGMQIPDYIRGNLLTTISQGANILGNTVNMQVQKPLEYKDKQHQIRESFLSF